MRLDNKKVAIIQNRLQRGGRLQVMINMIKVMNSINIEPDVLTLSSRINDEDIKTGYYDGELKFHIKEISKDLKIPFEWNIIYFNLVVNKYLIKYDLVINSNNTSFLLNKNHNLISYIHFPRKIRNISPKKSIHFPDGPDKSIFDYKSDFLRLASNLYRIDKTIGKKETTIANSIFTKKNILNAYVLKANDIDVIYPPVNIKKALASIKKNEVVSLGRFSKDKRQLDQIKLAKNFPKLKFYIIGFVNNAGYYNKCLKYIKDNNIENVLLKINIPLNELEKLFSRAKYFIHSLHNEPFGITTVQAIKSGLLPIVHNSGGQKEIVPIKELRYDNFTEAKKILKKIISTDEKIIQSYLKKLINNIRIFDSVIFDEKFKTLIQMKIDGIIEKKNSRNSY